MWSGDTARAYCFRFCWETENGPSESAHFVNNMADISGDFLACDDMDAIYTYSLGR